MRVLDDVNFDRNLNSLLNDLSQRIEKTHGHKDAWEQFLTSFGELISFFDQQGVASQRPKTAFISYAWGSGSQQKQRQKRIEELAKILKSAGLQKVFFDRTHMQGNAEEAMTNNVNTADSIVVIATPDYKQRAEDEEKATGVRHEYKAICQRHASNSNTFVVVFEEGFEVIPQKLQELKLIAIEGQANKRLQDWIANPGGAAVSKGLLLHLFGFNCDTPHLGAAYQQLWRRYSNHCASLDLADSRAIDNDIEEVTKQLLNSLKSYYSQQHEITSIFGKTTSLKDQYINLQILYHKAHEKGEVSKTAGPASDEQRLSSYEDLFGDKKTIKPSQLFLPDKELFSEEDEECGLSKKWQQTQPPNFLLIQGRAGIGKTTFMRFFARAWSLGSLYQNYEWVFVLNLRDLRSPTFLRLLEEGKQLQLHEWIYHSLVQTHCDISEEQFNQCWQENIGPKLNEEKVLLCIDGYDELPAKHACEQAIEALFHGKYANAHKVVTTRPYGIADLPLMRRNLEIIGFTNDNINTYISTYFNHDKGLTNSIITNLRANSALWGIAHIPVNLSLICGILDQTGCRHAGIQASGVGRLTSMSSTYKVMEEKLLERAYVNSLQAEGKKPLLSEFDELRQEFLYEHFKPHRAFLAELAFHALQQQQIILSSKLLVKLLKQHEIQDTALFMQTLRQLGLIRPVVEEGNVNTQHYEFMHLTFQEYYAAVHISNGLSSSGVASTRRQMANFVLKQKLNPQWQVVWWFLASLIDAEQLVATYELLQGNLSAFITAQDEPETIVIENLGRDLTGYYQLGLLLRFLDELPADSADILQEQRAEMTKIIQSKICFCFELWKKTKDCHNPLISMLKISPSFLAQKDDQDLFAGIVVDDDFYSESTDHFSEFLKFRDQLNFFTPKIIKLLCGGIENFKEAYQNIRSDKNSRDYDPKNMIEVVESLGQSFYLKSEILTELSRYVIVENLYYYTRLNKAIVKAISNLGLMTADLLKMLLDRVKLDEQEKCMLDRDTDYRCDLLEILGGSTQIKDQIVAVLRKYIISENYYIREGVIKALGNLGRTDEDLYQQLLTAAKKNHAARIALVKLGYASRPEVITLWTEAFISSNGSLDVPELYEVFGDELERLDLDTASNLSPNIFARVPALCTKANIKTVPPEIVNYIKYGSEHYDDCSGGRGSYIFDKKIFKFLIAISASCPQAVVIMVEALCGARDVEALESLDKLEPSVIPDIAIDRACSLVKEFNSKPLCQFLGKQIIYRDNILESLLVTLRSKSNESCQMVVIKSLMQLENVASEVIDLIASQISIDKDTSAYMLNLNISAIDALLKFSHCDFSKNVVNTLVAALKINTIYPNNNLLKILSSLLTHHAEASQMIHEEVCGVMQNRLSTKADIGYFKEEGYKDWVGKIGGSQTELECYMTLLKEIKKPPSLDLLESLLEYMTTSLTEYRESTVNDFTKLCSLVVDPEKLHHVFFTKIMKLIDSESSEVCVKAITMLGHINSLLSQFSEKIRIALLKMLIEKNKNENSAIRESALTVLSDLYDILFNTEEEVYSAGESLYTDLVNALISFDNESKWDYVVAVFRVLDQLRQHHSFDWQEIFSFDLLPKYARENTRYLNDIPSACPGLRVVFFQFFLDKLKKGDYDNLYDLADDTFAEWRPKLLETFLELCKDEQKLVVDLSSGGELRKIFEFIAGYSTHVTRQYPVYVLQFAELIKKTLSELSCLGTVFVLEILTAMARLIESPELLLFVRNYVLKFIEEHGQTAEDINEIAGHLEVLYGSSDSALMHSLLPRGDEDIFLFQSLTRLSSSDKVCFSLGHSFSYILDSFTFERANFGVLTATTNFFMRDFDFFDYSPIVSKAMENYIAHLKVWLNTHDLKSPTEESLNECFAFFSIAHLSGDVSCQVLRDQSQGCYYLNLYVGKEYTEMVITSRQAQFLTTAIPLIIQRTEQMRSCFDADSQQTLLTLPALESSVPQEDSTTTEEVRPATPVDTILHVALFQARNHSPYGSQGSVQDNSGDDNVDELVAVKSRGCCTLL